MCRLAASTGRGGRRHRGAGNGLPLVWADGIRRVRAGAEPQRSCRSRGRASRGRAQLRQHPRHQADDRVTRYFDSSLDPAHLQANIKLACWITKRASTLPDSAIPSERVRLGSHADGQVADSGDHLLRRFADLVFVRLQDKLKLYWLFQRSAWQPARRAA